MSGTVVYWAAGVLGACAHIVGMLMIGNAESFGQRGRSASLRYGITALGLYAIGLATVVGVPIAFAVNEWPL